MLRRSTLGTSRVRMGIGCLLLSMTVASCAAPTLGEGDPPVTTSTIASPPIATPTGGAGTTPSDATGPGRTVAYLSDLTAEGEAIMVTVDFARMLTGIEAEQAARAVGDLGAGENLPNDFYISNTDPTTSRLEVASYAEVEVQGCVEGRACPTFVPVTLDEWVTLHTGGVPNTLPRGFSWHGGGLLYGIAMEDGIVTTLIEQYLP